MAIFYGFSANELVWETKYVSLADRDSRSNRRRLLLSRYVSLIKKVKDLREAVREALKDKEA